MKTMGELSKSLGVTRQTIYNVIKETEGLSIDNLTTKTVGKTRYFDERSEKILSNAIKSRRDRKATIDNADRKLEEAQKRISDLTTRVEEQAAQIQKLREEADALRENNDILIRTNAANAMTIQQLQKEREQALLTAGQKETGKIRRAWRRLIGKGEASL